MNKHLETNIRYLYNLYVALRHTRLAYEQQRQAGDPADHAAMGAWYQAEQQRLTAAAAATFREIRELAGEEARRGIALALSVVADVEWQEIDAPPEG